MVNLRHQRLNAGERSLLLCAGVDVGYDSVQVLFGVDFEVQGRRDRRAARHERRRQVDAAQGDLRAATRRGGAVFFDGTRHHARSTRASAAQLGIVQMPGGRGVFPTLTVGENLRLAGWLYKRRDPEHVEAATAQVLEYFPVLRERHDQLAGNLSGGEQQMLASRPWPSSPSRAC